MKKLIIFMIICIKIISLSPETKIQVEKPIFTSQEIPDHIYKNMIGKSIPEEYKDIVEIDKLSYLTISYYGFDNKFHIGEMIVNTNIATEVLEIFKELYEIKYPIEKIKLIDEYNGEDELSMQDNNTSCFCYRPISGTNKLSKHAKGMAIDINPLYNPCVENGNILPVAGEIYADRNLKKEHQINEEDMLYKIFVKHGWKWGGNWNSKKDYQHFEK